MRKKIIICLLGMLALTGSVTAAENLEPQISRYKDQLRGNPENVSLLLKLSHLYLENGDYEQGEEYLLKAKKISPQDPQIDFSLASAYLLKRNQTALLEVLKTLSTLSLNETGRYQLASFYYLIKEFGTASVLADQLVTDFPNTAQYHALLSQCLKNSGKIPEAVAEIQKAIKLSQRPEYHFDLASLYMLQNRGEDARQEYLTYAENKSFVLTRIADDLQSRSLNEEALERYLHAFRLNPQNLQALISAAAMAKKLNRPDLAKSLLNEASQRSANGFGEWLALAYLYKDMGDYAQALACAESSLSAHPSAEGYLAEGYIYKDSGEVNKAVQSFEKVIALDAKNNQAYLALAWLYKDRGYLDKAYEYGVQALALSPQPKECEALFESMNNNTGYDLTKNIRVGEASEFQKIPEAIEYKVYDATRAQVLAGLTGTQPAPAPRPGLLTYFNNSLQTSFAYENLPIMHFGYTNTSFLDNKDQGLPGYNHMMIHAFDFSAQELLSREKFIWDTSLSLGYNRTFCRNPDNAPLYNEDKNIYYFAFKTEPVFRQFDIYGGVNYLNNTSIYSADYNQWDGRLEFRHSFKTLGASLNYGLDLTNAQYTSSIYKTRQDYFIAGYLPVLSPLATFSRLEAIINQGHELDDATSFLVSTHTYQFTEELHYPLLEPLILVPRGVLEWGSETHAYDNYLLGMELRYFLKTSSRREVAEKTVSWRETITATLGFKYDRYNQINWSYNQLYFRIYFFL